MSEPLSPDSLSGPPLSSTAELLSLARGGDATARDQLFGRYLPSLKRFAHGRLPRGARDLVDTDDVVQETLLRAFSHLENFEPRREGAFLSYLRQILVNQIRDQARRVARRPGREDLPREVESLGPSPLEVAIGRDTLARYEAALADLAEDYREALVLRIEMGFTYAQIAEALERVSPMAARLLVSRALVRLAEKMGEKKERR